MVGEENLVVEGVGVVDREEERVDAAEGLDMVFEDRGDGCLGWEG